MTEEKLDDDDAEQSHDDIETSEVEESEASEETPSLPDVDLKKFLGCGG